jgi:hypothetical protein
MGGVRLLQPGAETHVYVRSFHFAHFATCIASGANVYVRSRRGERGSSSYHPSDDEVGGLQGAIRAERAERAQQSKQ